MIIVRPVQPTNFERIVSGEITFYADEKTSLCSTYAKTGDFVAINEYDANTGDNTGRCVIMEVSAVIEEEDYYIYALQPCRIEPHRRLTAAVYGGETTESESQ